MQSLTWTNVLTASLISSSLFSSLALLSVLYFEADAQGAIVAGTFGAIVLTCLMVAEDDDRAC